MSLIKFYFSAMIWATAFSVSLLALESPLNWHSLLSKAESESSNEKNKANRVIKKGEFEIYSEGLIEKKVTCQYAYVQKLDNSASLRRIDPVLFYFHTPGDKNPLENNICESLSKSSGFTVFSLIFTQSSEMNLYYDDKKKKKFYAYESSGSFLAIKTAWETLKTKVKLNAEQFYLYGYSAGAIGVQRFSETYPELCAGAAIVCGHSYCEKKTARCPILLVSTYGDSGADDTDGLVKYYNRNSTPCISLHFSPNWNLLRDGEAYSFHAVHPLVAPLVQGFFDFLSSSRDKDTNGTIEFGGLVQYVANASDPRQIWSARIPGLSDSIKAMGGDPVFVPSARFYGEMIKNSPPIIATGEGNDLGIFSVPPQNLIADKIIAERWTSLMQDESKKNQSITRL